jgi:hypothetical protein
MSKLFCARQPKYSPSYFRGPLNYPCFSLPLPWIEDHILLFHGRPQVAKFEFWDFCTFSRWEHSDESICLSPHLTRVSLASSGRWGRWSKPRLVIFLFRVYKCYLTHCKLHFVMTPSVSNKCCIHVANIFGAAMNILMMWTLLEMCRY